MQVWRVKGISGHRRSWSWKSELKSGRRTLKTRRNENLENKEYNLPKNTN